jgi:hypothetical protein
MKTDTVMKQRVAQSTRDNYERSKIVYLLWLFENNGTYPDLLEPNLYQRMREANGIDQARRTRTGRPCKKRDSIKAVLHSSLRKIKSDMEEAIPIKLDQLTFTIFSRYLSKFKKKLRKKKREGK